MNFIDKDYVDVLIVRESNSFARSADTLLKTSSFTGTPALGFTEQALHKAVPVFSDFFERGSQEFSLEVVHEAITQALLNAFSGDGFQGSELGVLVGAHKSYYEADYYFMLGESLGDDDDDDIENYRKKPKEVDQTDIDTFLDFLLEKTLRVAMKSLAEVSAYRKNRDENDLLNIAEAPTPIKERLMMKREDSQKKSIPKKHRD